MGDVLGRAKNKRVKDDHNHMEAAFFFAEREGVSRRGREVEGRVTKRKKREVTKVWTGKVWRFKMIKTQERNWGISPAAHLRVEICVFMFGIWGKRQGLREEEGQGRGQWERNGEKRKQSAVLHTGGEVEPLARILLAMSAIWNVESLPLSALGSDGVVLCLPAPSLCSDSALKNRRRPRQCGRDATDKTHTPAERRSSMKSETPGVARVQADTL